MAINNTLNSMCSFYFRVVKNRIVHNFGGLVAENRAEFNATYQGGDTG